MKSKSRLMLTALLIIAFSAVLNATEDYIVGSEDMIEVLVLDHPEFNSISTVTPNGNIHVSLLGSIKVAGMSVREIKDRITQLLMRDYLKNAFVTVNVKESRSRKFYIYGEVVHPGAYVMKDNMTLLRGISMAGGLNKFASPRIKVFRQENNKNTIIKINVDRIISGKEADIIIQSGDVIIIEEKIF